MNDDVDTEIMLVSLASLLEPDVPDTSILLNTLVECSGNVEAAAQRLRWRPASLSDPPDNEKRKRKRAAVDLDDWLSSPSTASSSAPKKKPVSEVKPPSTGTVKVTTSTSQFISASKPHSAGSTPAKPVDLMSILKAPPSEKQSAPRFPPLTLTNPQMVAKHTPCTLHTNILPPEVACELFYTMLDAAQGWSRNKWWLFDRVVESPHRTSFFARIDKRGTSDKDMQEEAQFWYV